jgi:hypothetical protein
MNVRLNSTTGQSPEQRKNAEEKRKTIEAIKAQQSAGALTDPKDAKPCCGGSVPCCKVAASGKYAGK